LACHIFCGFASGKRARGVVHVASEEARERSEIEQAIAAGLYMAFNKEQQLSTEVLLGEI
jgi:hypothetical protein